MNVSVNPSSPDGRLRRLRGAVIEILLSDLLWKLLPTPAAYLFNRVRMREPATMPSLPDDDWALMERRALLVDSHERRASLEGKGPGLATVTAVVVAGSVLAIVGGWHESTLIAKIILVIAGVYTGLSLLTPLYLVGPVKRSVITTVDLTAAAKEIRPEQAMAHRAADAAMATDFENQRIANLLDAARRELAYSMIALLVWVVLVPVAGILER